MKKTLTIILIFAAVLVALLGVSALVERLRPPAEPAPTAEETERVIANVMEPNTATIISLENGTATHTGQGVTVDDGVVTIGYPGTYRVSGELAGQLVVNCGDFHGGVYIMLEGASVTCDSGPALYVAQSDRTVLYLVKGTENAFRDGENYVLTEGKEQRLGAGIYSADDLFIEGEGSLAVTGSNADGIRTKDALTVTGGTLTVYSADDGLQGSDCVDIQGGDIAIYAYGDGVTTTQGGVTVTGGDVTVVSAGDGVSAAEDVVISDGNLTVTAYGGWENYTAAELAAISADGLKGRNITVTGGSLTLNTAGDGLNGDGTVTVAGGSISLSAGDDGLHADGTVMISGGTVDIAQSYEALEAERVRVTGGEISAVADNNALSAGDGGFAMEGGTAVLSAPCCVKTTGNVRVEKGTLLLTAEGTEAPVSFAGCTVTGGTVALCAAGTDTSLILEAGEIPGSLLFGLGSVQPAGTALILKDAAGSEVLAFETSANCGTVLIASGALGVGQTYTLTAGEQTLEVVVGEGCAVTQAAAPAAGGLGGPSGGMPPRPGGAS